MIRKGTGRGKLILFGEHAAVYGYPAVGTSLPCRLELSWENGGNETETPDEKGLDREVFISLLNTARKASKKPDFPESGKWQRLSDVPRTGGFGSSAALCVSISRIVLNRPEEIYDSAVHLLANHLEMQFHGTPSGIDTGMAADNGTASWLKSGRDLPDRQILNIPKWSIIYGALPRSASTAETVGRLRRSAIPGNSAAKSAMKDLGDIASGFIDASEESRKDFPITAAEMANRAQKILSSLDLSTHHLDALFKIAEDEGALGGKLSGGGMGGAFYICASDRDSRDRILGVLPEKLAGAGIELTVPLTAMDFGILSC